MRSLHWKFALGLLALTLSSSQGFAIGGEAGNGGEPNEIKFKAIAFNIKQWLESGNADGIQLPATVSLGAYKSTMISKLENFQIEFTIDPVIVAGSQKTCKNFVDDQQMNRIVCNSAEFSRYYQTSMDDIYRIIHHEFAGLAGLEESRGQVSDYTISSQLSAFLQTELVKRLPIYHSSDATETWLPASGWRNFRDAGDPRGVFAPFVVDQDNQTSTYSRNGKSAMKSLAQLFENEIALSSTDVAGGVSVEMRASNSVSVLQIAGGSQLETVGKRIPEISPQPLMDYNCTLVETGELLHVATGAHQLVFPSQRNVDLTAGRVVINSSDETIYVSRYIAKTAGRDPAYLSKTVVKFNRGNEGASIKFLAVDQVSQASVACEILNHN